MGMSRKDFLRLSMGTLMVSNAQGGFFKFLNAPSGFPGDIVHGMRVIKIHKYIAQHKAEHISRVQEYLRQPSVSATGFGMQECVELLMTYFKRLGCAEVTLVKTDGYPGVWAYYDAGAARTICYYMMYDTQPFDEKEWSSPPLAANVVKKPPFGEVIIARGAKNNKGGDAMAFNALESIVAVEGRLPVNIMFVCDGEEEQDSPHFHQVVQPYAERLKTCSAALSLIPSQDANGNIQVYLGAKGVSASELVCSGSVWGRGPQLRPFHSSRKAIMDSPTWRLLSALQTMVTPDGNHILIDGFYDAIRPPNEEEQELYKTLVQRFSGQFLRSEKEDCKTWINDWSDAEALYHLLFDPSLNIDGIYSGYIGTGAAHIVPSRAAAKIDFRLLPDQEVRQAQQLLRHHLDKHGYPDVEVIPFGGDEWSQTSVKAPIVQSVVSVYKEYGIEPALWPREAASGPQATYTRPPLSLAQMEGGLGHGGNIHSVDEYIVIEGNERVAGIVKAEQSYVDLLFAYAGWPEMTNTR